MNRAAHARQHYRFPTAYLAVLSALFSVLSTLIANAADPQALEFFERKIRPLLVDRCYPCHSAASERLKGGLLLDSRQGLLAGGDSGPALLPGDPDNSLLIEAIGYGNEHLQMPPKEMLAEGEIADLVAWVKQGAPWPDDGERKVVAKAFDLQARRASHWSWQPVQAVAPPAVQAASWPATPVDHFVLARLEAQGLAPAPAAQKREWLRRVYFDLIGLPPKPQELQAFLDDASPAAHERVVDRLLASPQFGERWARYWLDLVRYAETLGHEFDYAIFNAWRYRDYVIRAFNADVPYDQFILEHVAGDLLPSPRRHPTQHFNESIIGTGFYWLGQRVHSPVDIRQEQAEVVDNQLDVTTKTFLGLTVACARCHDHKFDAISTRDYYALFGIMGSSRYAQRALEMTDSISETMQALAALKQELRPLIAEVWLGQASNIARYLIATREVEPSLKSEALNTRLAQVAAEKNLDAARLGYWFKALKAEPFQDRGALDPWREWFRVRNEEPARGSFEELWSSAVKDFRQNTGSQAGGEPEASQIPKFSEWSLEDEGFAEFPSPAGDFVVGDSNKVVRMLLPAPSANSASISRRLEGVLRSPTFTITNGYLHILAAGASSRLNVRIDNFTMIRDPIYGGLKRWLDQEKLSWLTVDLNTWKGHRAYLEFNDLPTPDPSDEADRKFDQFAYVVVSRVVFSDSAAPPVSHKYSQLLSPGDLESISSIQELAQLYEQGTVAAVQAWVAGSLGDEPSSQHLGWLHWLVANSLLEGTGEEAALRLSARLAEFRTLENSLPERSRAVGMIDGTGLNEVVFIRGNHKTPGPVVPRRFLEALGGSDEQPFQHGSGRLELAGRLIDPANPFTSRVMVNRVWQHLFGRGLVSTPDDFGVLGEPPSHPELLDWLADWYRTKGGWSTKALIRMLVTSSTYRMSSKPVDPEAEQKDPENVWLHRMSVQRLECESIRDALLEISGQLDRTLFGPPVPVHLTDFLDGRGRPSHSGPLDGDARRSIYQEVRRNFLSPMMRTFDFPVPFTTIGKRTSSNVPAQSLILMNDAFVISQAQAWAKAALAIEPASPEARIHGMYERLVSRPPTPEELGECLAFLEQQAQAYGLSPTERLTHEALWTDLCHVLINLKEFIFVN